MRAINPPTDDLDATISAAIDNKTKPRGALGRIERLAARLARIQATLRPRMERCTLTIFAGDHGIAEEGVSAYPRDVTAQMVANFLAGGAAANVFAQVAGVDMQVVDAGVAVALPRHSGLRSERIAPGTRNFACEPAMTDAQLGQALETGFALAHQEDAHAAAFGEMGIANTSSAALLAHKLEGIALRTLVGRGTGLDDQGLARKQAVLARAAARTGDRLSANEALAQYGGFEIAMMTGAMLGAAAAGRAVLVDGFIATAAALCARDIDAGVDHYLIFAHQSAEPGHRAMLGVLGAEPLLDLEMRLGEGTGALLAWPLLRSAAAMLADMASFESAGVSGPASD